MDTNPPPVEVQQVEELSTIDSFKQELCSWNTGRKEYFDRLPHRITEFKQNEILNRATVNQRFVLLCLGALGVAGLSVKYQPQFIRVIRNTFISYVGLGLFIVPEVFNPYLIFRYKE